MMATYQFQCIEDEKDVLEKDYPMSDAPPIGSLVHDRGRWYRRVPGDIQIDAGAHNIVHKYPYVSKVLPRRLAGCKTNKRGQPIIENRAHEREVCARHGYVRD